jgi:multiple sugar transport system permease protein
MDGLEPGMSVSVSRPRPATTGGPQPVTHELPLKRPLKERLAAPFFIAPATVFVAVVLLLPMAWTLGTSLTRYNGVSMHWTGLDNYVRLFSDPGFGQSLLNTVMWSVGSLVLPVALGLLIAVVTQGSRLGTIARIAVIIPYALSGTATGVIYDFMLRSDGAVNQVLTTLGLDPVDWLLHWPLNTVTMIIASTWQATGINVVLFMVGLQTVPTQTIEAGRLDGASGGKLFWRVVFPQMASSTIVVVGMALANSLKTFDLVWLLTGGGPGTASETLALTMYRQTFLLSRYGLGAATAVVLAVIVVAASWLYLRRSLRPEPTS